MLYKVSKFNIVDDEIEEVIKYYESISYELGIKVENEIFAALNILTSRPLHYFYLSDKIHRRIIIEGFPYMLVYSIEINDVIVKMLFPQKADPAKLLERLIGKDWANR